MVEGKGSEEVQRWTAKRRLALVLSIVKGETSIQEAARRHGLTVADIEQWQEKFLTAGENALRARPKDEDSFKDERIRQLERKVGQLVLEQDIMREAIRPYHPFVQGTPNE